MRPGVLDPVTAVYTARAFRDFGDGFIAILLPVYLLALGLSATHVGIIATSALFGSALLTLVIGQLGGRYDLRRLLLCASALMALTGVVYAASSDYAVLIVVAFIGTINPSGGSTSIFVPLEHTVLTGAVTSATRTRSFARYSLIGALAGAFGSLLAAAPDWMGLAGVDRLDALRIMFIAYGILGIAGGFAYTQIPRRPIEQRAERHAALGPSRGIVYKLAALFSIDSFAGGFVVQSLLALWLFEYFQMSLGAASIFFFWTGVFSAFSFPVAAWLGTRIGLVNTMVFTHIPSSLCLIAAAFAPSLEVALALLLIRSALSQMDVPTRSSYVMAVVTEAERPAAASVTAVPRSLASAASPAIAGALFAAGLHIWPLLLCGGLKILYDLLLLAAFRMIKPPEEQGDRPAAARGKK
ncbi:MAG: MFS transporter [Betaproteobacteria bacterium]|nr:MFS transporter [Betaproteobacteria bacterium]